MLDSNISVLAQRIGQTEDFRSIYNMVTDHVVEASLASQMKGQGMSAATSETFRALGYNCPCAQNYPTLFIEWVEGQISN
tara:strand:- start:967 stop:1206 length:240 start_codon:yes stop_codon:yes gene_type:complete